MAKDNPAGGQTPQIAVPSDTPPTSFGEVNDTAAANSAPAGSAPTASAVQDGWVTTGSEEAQNIASKYSPLNNPPKFASSPVGVSNLPY